MGNANELVPIAGIPQVYSIANQTIPVNVYLQMDFRPFAVIDPSDDIAFSIENFPPGFVIEPATGVVQGQASANELGKSFFVTFAITNLSNGKYAKVFFNIFIQNVLQEYAEDEISAEDQLSSMEKKVSLGEIFRLQEIRFWVQQLINEHFVWLVIYDASPSDPVLGKFEGRREAKSGWTILKFANAVMITPGKEAFAEYGNRGRLLTTLREVYSIDVKQKAWPKIGIEGSDVDNISRGWVIATNEFAMPVSATAPTQMAELMLDNLNRVIEHQMQRNFKAKPY